MRIRPEIMGLDDDSPFLRIRMVCADCEAVLTDRRLDCRTDDAETGAEADGLVAARHICPAAVEAAE